MTRKFDYKLGIISDTHGLVRQSVVKLFKDVDLIVHAGDVGTQEALETLQTVATVHPVRGNVDSGEWTDKLPLTEVVEVGQVYLYVLHDLNSLDLDPVTAGFNVVISGHSHIPKIKNKDGILFLNPGSAGPIRFKYPASIAFLYIKGTSIEVELVELKE
ncbi:MAG: metallophosphatase family protein [Candidatus Scalindua rubra]|uniref:Phosphoesterase n=1 Tax=Candidatus Scalindua brodae TaxID=237368 RepID=A0A0B0EPP3_9BACT|nr:MAG: putative phosphodiesterase [Candidatus Scalindua brodae]MBZ0109689.1 metallophosphatase family protein [Candidatus Scalindua rubra]